MKIVFIISLTQLSLKLIETGGNDYGRKTKTNNY